MKLKNCGVFLSHFSLVSSATGTLTAPPENKCVCLVLLLFSVVVLFSAARQISLSDEIERKASDGWFQHGEEVCVFVRSMSSFDWQDGEDAERKLDFREEQQDGNTNVV